VSDSVGPDSRYSWLVATVGAIAMIFTFGTPLSYGIFRGPFSEAFGIEPIALSTIFSIMLLTFFVGSGVIGVFAIRVPARAVILTCAATTAVLAPSLYFVDSFVALLVVFAVLGLALGTVFVLVASIVPRWFDERRGAATGLIFVGNGLGLFLLPPLWQAALSTIGVERAFLMILAVTALAFALAGVLCRRPPWTTTSTATTIDLVGWLRTLAGTRRFQVLFVGIGLAFAWYQLLAAFASDLFIARGLTASGAATMFGLIGGVSIISRIGGGYFADRVGSRRAFLVSLGCAIVGIALLVAPNLPVLALAVILIGLGLGGCAALYIPLLLTVYPPEKDSAVVGVFNVAAGVGSLAMPPLGTASIAYTEGYTAAVVLTVVVSVTAFWLVVSGTAPTTGG